MTLFGTRSHYGPIVQSFHWLMVVMVVAALATAFATGNGGGDGALTVHKALGLAVFVMAALRLAWRALDRLPGKPPKGHAAAQAAWLVDILLYVLLFAVPVAGLIGAQELPAMAAGLHPERGVIDLHRLFGVLLLVVAGLHSAFALYHHYFLKDGVLKMMLPGGRAA